MNEWQHFEPIGGWVSFTESGALTEALWAEFPSVDWHYLNFVMGSSIWESKQDASAVVIHYERERLVEFVVQYGKASDVVGPIIARFQLAAVPPVG
jgi:hypothetical protein